MSPTATFAGDVRLTYSEGLPCFGVESSVSESQSRRKEEISESSSLSGQRVNVEFETYINLNAIYNLGRPLAKAIPVVIRFEDGFYYVSNSELGILVGGDSCAEAIEEFCSFFVQDFQTWTETPDTKLTEKALNIIGVTRLPSNSLLPF